MSSPTSVLTKGKQRATEDKLLTFDDLDVASDSGSSSGSSSSDSDLGSDSDSVSDSDSSTGHDESGFSKKTEPGANNLPLSKEELLAYLENMRRRFSTKHTTDSFANQDEEVLVVTSKKKNIPKLDLGKLPEPYLTFKTTQSGNVTLSRDAEVEEVDKASKSTTTGSQQYVPAPPPQLPEVGKSGKPLSKKEKKALKVKTAGKDWFDLPAPDEADLPRLYREYEALRLRNNLDPKRFYRKDEGEGKGIKGLPKYFAIGTVLPTKTPFGEPSGGDLTRSERKRTLVEELLHDSEAKDHAKKKFKQMQETRGANGRGQHAKKKAALRSKW